jgi:hypothetical protein
MKCPATIGMKVERITWDLGGFTFVCHSGQYMLLGLINFALGVHSNEFTSGGI